MKSLVSESWWGDRPFDGDRLLADAAPRTTLIGYLREEPVGVLQLGPEKGWISLLCIRGDQRKRGFGAQLIGQAVQQTRSGGGEKLLAALPAACEAEEFFADYGFGPAEEGGRLLEKDIRFLPEFLGI